MSKKFTFDKFGGDGCTVYLDDGASGSVAFFVDPAGDQLFSASVRAGNQHPAFCGSDFVQQLFDGQDGGAFTDDVHSLGATSNLFL